VTVNFLNAANQYIGNGLTLIVPQGFFTDSNWQVFEGVTTPAPLTAAQAQLSFSTAPAPAAGQILVDEVILMDAIDTNGSTGTTGATGATGKRRPEHCLRHVLHKHARRPATSGRLISTT
jgi:hypothetical protein